MLDCYAISCEMFLFWLTSLLWHSKKVCLGQESCTLVLSSLLTPSGSALIRCPIDHYYWGSPHTHKAVSLVRVLLREFHPNFLLRVLLDPGRLTYPAKYRLLGLLREQWPLLMTRTLAESDRPNFPWTNLMQASWWGLYLGSVVSLSSPVWARLLVSQFR